MNKHPVTERSAENNHETPVGSVVLPDLVVKNVEVIHQHQSQHQQKSKTHHRALDKIGSIFGQPQFLYGQIVFFTVWIVCSNLAERDIIAKNFPIFDPDYQGLEVASLLTSTGVLVYQTRQEKISGERSHLMLQLNLATEQKIAKLISLVEELRTDLPNVKNRDDLEADMMKQAIDPGAVLEIIQHNLENSAPVDVKHD
jgi:uncharacterized membrane protein